MRIDVTAGDIADGERGDCSRCPVALAVSRVAGVPRVVIGAGEISLIHGVGKVVHHRAPRSVVEFIGRFDCGQQPGPFSFDLP